MNGLPSLSGGTLERGNREKFVCEAAEVITFRLAESVEDLHRNDETRTFKPEFTHQVFGDNEVIFGYKGLKVDIFFTVGSLKQFVRVNYTDRVPSSVNVEPDNILKLLMDQTPSGFTTNESDFVLDIEKDRSFRPAGTLIACYQNDEKKYEIYSASFKNNQFRDFHSRMQTFILWYIDAASYLDSDDLSWKVYTLFEKVKEGNSVRYSSIGFLSCYSYYHYPNKVRPRISQVLILPPYQKQGHGAHLLSALYDDISRNSSVYDITVEDPSENFTRLRNYVDVLKCCRLASFQPDKLKRGFTQEMVDEARSEHKITAIQVRKIYEILRLRATDVSDSQEYRKYRLDVKRRINIPFLKEKRNFEKLSKFLKKDEFAAVMNSKSAENQQEFLQKSYKELEFEYRKVIERLSTHIPFP